MHSLTHILAGDEGDEAAILHDMGEGNWGVDQFDEAGREHRVVLGEAQLVEMWGIHTSRYGTERVKNTDHPRPVLTGGAVLEL